MRAAALIVATLTCLAIAVAAPAGDFETAVPAADWQKANSPQDIGWSAEGLAKIGAYTQELHSTAVMIVQHGVVVAAWGDCFHPINIHSSRKSLLSALIGIAATQGQLPLDDTLEKLGIDDRVPSLSRDEKQASVRELLQARSGVYHQAAYETEGMKDKRPSRGEHPHGTFWYYNNWDFNTLGYIYEKSTREKIFDAFDREIAKPIGMQDYSPRNGSYVYSKKSLYPAYLFALSARDFARFALLFLHGGNWNGAQVIPQDWVKQSTTPYSDTHSGGYGYLWWTAESASKTAPEIRFPHGSFWAEGHLGQFAVVIPSRDMVVVHMQADASHAVSKSQMAKLLHLVIAAAPASPAGQ